MYNQELTQEIHSMFVNLHRESMGIVTRVGSGQQATEEISKMVASKVTAESEGYVVDMYASLAEKVKADPYFQDSAHLNQFYRLNLREKITEAYQFEVKELSTFAHGISYDEIKKTYVAAGVTAGTMAVGGILTFALAGPVLMPLLLLLVGAVAIGMASYATAGKKNEASYRKGVREFLDGLEQDIVSWLQDVENYLESQIRTLY